LPERGAVTPYLAKDPNDATYPKMCDTVELIAKDTLVDYCAAELGTANVIGGCSECSALGSLVVLVCRGHVPCSFATLLIMMRGAILAEVALTAARL
jgi:hypothetical protein